MNTALDSFARASTDARLTRAAQALAALRAPGARPADLPPELAPTSQEEAYELQRVTAYVMGARVGGWKVALSANGSGMSAPVFAADVLRSPARIASVLTTRIGIEPEIAFTLARDLPPLGAGSSYDRDRVLAALGSAHAAIEVLITRFARLDTLPLPTNLADNISNGGLVIGAPEPHWLRLPIAQLPLRLTLRSPGVPDEVYEVRGGHPLGDPLLPMLWLANHCSQRGLTLYAGQVVTTGSCAGMRFVGPGSEVRAHFEGLGSAQLTTA